MHRILSAALGSFLVLAVGIAPASAANQFVLGSAESVALDQPRVAWGLFDGEPTGSTLVGPSMPYSALLDTGATGIVLGDLAYIDSSYESQVDGNGQPIQFIETGVNGQQSLDLIKPYTLVIGDPFTGVGELQIDNVAALGAPSTSLGSFSAIIGMPAMIDRRTLIDLTPLKDADFIDVGLNYGSAGFDGVGGPVFDVPLTLVDYSPEEGPAPTFAPLPFINGITGERDGVETQGGFNFVLDTGAQLSIISSQFAAEFGITLDEDGAVVQTDAIVGQIDVQGIGGGVRTMDLVRIGELRVPTTSGTMLVFQNVDVGVLDIDPSIDGVFGMNFLTSGYSGAIFGEFTLSDLLGDEEFLAELANLGLIQESEAALINNLFALYEQLGIDPDEALGNLAELYPDLFNGLNSLLAPVLDAPTQPYFNRLILDFADGTATGQGVMRLELNPAVVPEPSLAIVGLAGLLLITRRRAA